MQRDPPTHSQHTKNSQESDLEPENDERVIETSPETIITDFHF